MPEFVREPDFGMDAVDAWHQGAGEAFDINLAAYLGMTPAEYGLFVQHGLIPKRLVPGDPAAG